MNQEPRAARPTFEEREWLHASGELALFLLVWFWLMLSRFSREPFAQAAQPAAALATLAYWVLWVVVGLPFTRLVNHRPIERPHRLRRTAFYAVLGLLAGLVHGFLHVGVTSLLPASVRPRLGSALLGGATYGQLVFWGLLVLKHASYYYRSARDVEIRAAQIEESLARARVDALKLRIRPESVLARLRDIARQLRRDPRSADDRVVRLGISLRRRLEGAPQPKPGEGGGTDGAERLSPFFLAGLPKGWFDWKAELSLLVFWNAAMLGPVLSSWYFNTPGVDPHRLRARTLELVLHATIWVLVCLPLAALVQRYPIEAPRRLRRLLAYSGVGLVLGTAHAVLHFSTAHLLLDRSALFYASSFRFNLGLDLSIGQANFGIFLLVKHIWYFRRRYRDQAKRAAELGAELSRAQLGALQMQLQPHFLFNTLHSISELIHEDAAAAEEMTTRLGDFLKLTFESSDDQLVTLGREMEFLDHYLGIQRIRFPDRLEVEVDVAPPLRALLVPNLILQPLVENAIKHGIARRRAGGRVSVRARQDEAGLEIQIQDEGTERDGPASTRAAVPHTGIGLRNVESRLRHLYGRGHDLKMEANAGGGVTVSLTIPIGGHLARDIGRHYLATAGSPPYP